MITIQKKTIVMSLFFLLSLNNALASYYIHLMNNTPKPITVNNTCGSLDVGQCTTMGNGKIEAFQRKKAFTVNYDQGITWGEDYTIKSYFPTADGNKDNYFSITLHGDWIGSHISDISVFVNGEAHHLLNSDNAKGKVLPNIVGHYNFVETSGQRYTVYADAQADRLTTQGIDSIYLGIDQKLLDFKRNDNSSEILLANYNIQAFPNYIGVALDLNKVNSRIAYLATQPDVKNNDVIVFEEAWDRNTKKTLKEKLHDNYPYALDPIPNKTHGKPLNSGLLVLSKYPINATSFVNYQDYQSLVDADALTNKGVLCFKINKKVQYYNIIATHTQAQDDSNAIKVRQQEFSLIKDKIIASTQINIPKDEPLVLMGDLNTDYYKPKQFNVMKQVLNLNTENMPNALYSNPTYSYDNRLNLMIASNIDEKGMYDYIIPVEGFAKPTDIQHQIVPIRAMDDNRMYQRSKNIQLYSYGNIEVSDHFMVGAKLKWNLDANR